MRTTLAFLLAVTVSPALVTAQDTPVRIIGRVVAHENGQAIAGATVRVGGMQFTTDRRGRFVAAPIAAGRQALVVEMIGYATRTDTVKFTAGSSDLTIRLSRQPVQLPPVIVTVRSSWLEENGLWRIDGSRRRWQRALAAHSHEFARLSTFALHRWASSC